jgi:preprotein translocase SecE subunit
MEKTATVKSNLISSVIEELKKVTWPTRASTIKLTLTVLIISLIVGAYLGIIDVFLAKGLEALTKR